MDILWPQLNEHLKKLLHLFDTSRVYSFRSSKRMWDGYGGHCGKQQLGHDKMPPSSGCMATRINEINESVQKREYERTL